MPAPRVLPVQPPWITRVELPVKPVPGSLLSRPYRAGWLALLIGCAAAQPPLRAQVPADSLGDRSASGGVEVEYGYVRFDAELDPWRLASVSVRQGTAAGPLIARASYADRFGERGVQVEADAYPRLSDRLYAYLNAGYAPTGLFPTWRLGGELYGNLPGAWEASAGVRQLRFDESSVTLLTGSVGKYAGNYWVSVRPFARLNSGQVSATGVLTGRRYFADADQYVGARLGYGSAPSEDPTPEELTRLSSLSAGLHGSHPLRRGLFGLWSAGAQREELATGVARDRLELTAGLRVNW